MSGARAAYDRGDWADCLAQLDAVVARVGITPRVAALRSRAREQRGDAGGALADARLVCGLSPTDGAARVRLGRLLLKRRDTVGALDAARAALDLDPGSSPAWSFSGEVLHALGRAPQAVAAMLEAARCAPTDVTSRIRAARSLLGLGDAAAASLCTAEAVALEPRSALHWLAHAEALAASGALDEAYPAAERALALDGSAWRAVLLHAVGAGAFDRAAALIAGARAAAPSDAEPLAMAARLAMWRGHDADARELVGEALVRSPDHVGARFMAGVLALLSQDALTARNELTWVADALRKRPDPVGWLRRDTVLTWLASAHAAMGDARAATQVASEALGEGPAWNAVTLLVRTLLAAGASDAPPEEPSAEPPSDVELDAALRLAWDRQRNLVVAGRRQLDGVRRDLNRALAALGRNRSGVCTLVRDQRLVRYSPPVYPRSEARKLELLLRTRPVDDVLERFRVLQAKHPDDPTTHTYHGETLLWLGRYAEAEVEMRAAIARFDPTTWAWIGLGASQMLRLEPELALRTWETGVEKACFQGPTLFVYRAEAWMQLGEYERAAQDLDIALTDKPHRLSAWMLRARVLSRTQPHAARVMWAEIERRLPGLALDVGDVADPLGEALARMRGNRSASVATWLGDDGAARFGTWERGWMTIERLMAPAPA